MHDRRNDVLGCDREADFVAMYAARDSRKRQDDIRELNPKAPHCVFLKRSHTACDALPEGAPPEYVGKPCPKNPHVLHGDLMREADELADLLGEAFYIEDLRRLGQLPGSDKLTTEEFTAALIMRSYTVAHERPRFGEEKE